MVWRKLSLWSVTIEHFLDLRPHFVNWFNFETKKHRWLKRLGDNVECWCSVANTNTAITLHYDVHYAIPACPSWQWQSQWQWQSSPWQWQWQWSPGAPRSTILCSSPPASLASEKHSKLQLVNFHNTCGHVFVTVVVGSKFFRIIILFAFFGEPNMVKY